MTDPLDALREPIRPVAPDPAFAARLRTRLERAVFDPMATQFDTWEDDMLTTDTPSTEAAVALALSTVTPYLTVADAAAALTFYSEAFGGIRRGEPIVMPDGRIGHAEIALGDSVLMLAEEFPEMGLVAPTGGSVAQSLRLEVADPDTVVGRALARGARLERPVTESPYGRGGVVIDPSGHRWMVSREAPVAAGPAAPRPGEVGYASLWTHDVEAAERFYTSVLGWETTAGSAPQGRQVTNLARPLGMWGGQERTTLFLCFAVPDVDDAVALVRAAGGTAGDPAEEPYGRIADCVDDQGLPFAVFAAPPGSGPRPAPTQPGELASARLEVPDTTLARAFYGTVLGWRFVPGREAGGWEVRIGDGVPRPALHVTAGREAAGVPAFGVADVATAVDAVRAAGGTAAEPRFEDHRATACTDDQGTRFDLVEHPADVSGGAAPR
ncbi:VOC family protein [Pseudonocardia bannensis]|uniref:Glyoxalase n=1 Tax=Pseudonocardia bannensis TaxID=630973 RepID=A0A848DMT1_9PSEU|nr:VOC family protein [Pseudonocardia bannensis]NMH94052.1 glyoxalase [Pseudonocardia bannensis]